MRRKLTSVWSNTSRSTDITTRRQYAVWPVHGLLSALSAQHDDVVMEAFSDELLPHVVRWQQWSRLAVPGFSPKVEKVIDQPFAATEPALQAEFPFPRQFLHSCVQLSSRRQTTKQTKKRFTRRHTLHDMRAAKLIKHTFPLMERLDFSYIAG